MSQEIESACTTCAVTAGTETHKSRQYKYRMAVLSASMLVLGIALGFLSANIILIYCVFLASMLSAGQFILPRGARGLMKLRLDMHFLMSTASIGAFIIGAPAEGAAVMFLFFISMLLEERAEDQVRHELEQLIQLEPPSATIKMKDAEACIPTSEVNRGDVLIVRPGGKIGLDGVVVYGETSVNQAPITGESIPVAKIIGDKVYAGTINQEGYIEVEVTSKSNETVLSKIVELVADAKNKKAPTEKLIDRFSRKYTPVMVTLTILLGLGTWILGASPVDATYRALTLLVISCPCAFVVSIPVSIVSSIAGSARDGVLVKGGIYIEQVSKTKTVAFDKTGTLTDGELSVKEVCLHNNFSREEVLITAATLEQMSEHPIARALVDLTKNEDMELRETFGFSAIPGLGIEGKIGDATYLVGNRRLLMEQSIMLDEPSKHSCGVGTLVYVAQGNIHLGTIVLADSLRVGAVEAVRELKSMGIHTVMLTGDSETVAKDIAQEVGVDEYMAELLPEEKVAAIKEISTSGSSIMVGDGVNDAPALATADVGIAMGAVSSDAALETSDIALMQQDLRNVPGIIKKAKKTMRIVRQNITLSISVKLFIGVFAAFGLVSLWMAIGIGDMGLTFAVIANALRLVRRNK